MNGQFILIVATIVDAVNLSSFKHGGNVLVNCQSSTLFLSIMSILKCNHL